MIIKSAGHQHLFDKEITIRVPIRKDSTGIVGYDMIKSRECSCGATIAYDLERKLK